MSISKHQFATAGIMNKSLCLKSKANKMWSTFVLMAIMQSVLSTIGYCEKLCDDRPTTKFCDYAITPHPIVDNVISSRLGVDRETCMNLVLKHQFPFGAYCETSAFCGLGIDLDKDYSHLQLSENYPVYEKCIVIVNEKKFTCDSVKQEMYEVGLLSDQLLCAWTGNKFCLNEKKAICVQLEGNFMCDGCYPGYEPVNPPNEQHCQDTRECDLGYCEEYDCNDFEGGYSCTCPPGYIFNAAVTKSCYEELPGYSVEMTYYAFSGGDLYYKYQHWLNYRIAGHEDPDNSDSNYMNPDAHDNIRGATEIVFVVYDDLNNPREQLTFRGNHELYDWFKIENVLNSSNWDVTSESHFEQFDMKITKTSSFFDISETQSNQCNPSSGFLKIICVPDENCVDFQWWADNANDKDKVCAIKYSKLKWPTTFSNAYIGNKFTIFTLQYPAYNENWLLNFRFSSFTKANFRDFLMNGGFASNGYNYRDKNIQNNFASAENIMLVVYDESGNTWNKFVFRVLNAELDTWFDKNDLSDPASFNSNFDLQFQDSNGFTFLNIGNHFDDCATSFGILTISCKPLTLEEQNQLCDFHQQWWLTRNTDGYCAILYSVDPVGTLWSAGGFKYATRIEIATTNKQDPNEIDWKLVFLVPENSGLDVSDYFQTGLHDALGHSAINPETVYRHGNLLEELAEADDIKFQVYDDGSVVEEMLFQGTGDSTSWFSFSNYQPGSISEWGLSDAENVAFDFVKEDGRDFAIWQEGTFPCGQDVYWFFIASRKLWSCEPEDFNNGTVIENKFRFGGDVYPEIRYRDKSEFQKENAFGEAKKIEIWVK